MSSATPVLDREVVPIADVAGSTVDIYDGTGAEWDAFVRVQSGSTHCHLYEWRNVMKSVFGHDCAYLAVRDHAGRIEGVLPLVRVKSRVFGHFLVSMPFLNYGGPLGSPRATAQLAGAAAKRAGDARVSLLELRSRAPWFGAPTSGWTASTRKITVLLDLKTGAGPGALWKELDAKVRSQVRRPQKDGVTVRFGVEQLEPFYAVFAHHMRDLGTPVLPRRFFEAVSAAFPDDVWFGCAYIGDTPVAAGCGFRWQSEFEMTWASSLAAYKRSSPNMLLYWAFMERAVEAGLTTFNFGRCTTGSGTHKFKLQWGACDEQLWWYDWQPGDAGVSQSAPSKTPSPDDSQFAWGPRLWKRLPLSVATALGPRIVKYIP
jgi:FemAB-related protein (PEP-CTERM system-associated)